MKKNLLLLSILLISCNMYAADTLRVLFIGNSYTAVQNLPQVVSRLASAGGDSLYYQVNAPGGYTLQQHSTDNATLSYIAQGNWDFVVLQEQSQLPSFNDGQVATAVYPYAHKLDSLIHHYTPCAKTVFYMTWGRKNGDASNCAVWPPVCTYDGMDSLLQLRYTIMAADNIALISPVAKLWHYLRDNSPSLELYQADESHPSPAGTYAAALSFYSLFFGKNPVTNSYNFTLSSAEANTVKAAAEAVVFDSLNHWKRFYPYPKVDSIVFNLSNNTVHCTPVGPQNVVGYEWDFGDASPHSVQVNPSHTFAAPGTYTICLTIHGVCDDVTYCKDTTIVTLGIDGANSMEELSAFPNPATNQVIVQGLRGKVAYTVTDALGVKVGQGEILPGRSTINMRSLSSGIYFLNLNNQKGKRRVMKLVKQ
ncbi:MAG: PKD domain-containing protein [Taibaiella sp.]|jgi:hypothetical protein